MELRESEEIFIYPGVARARGGTSLCEMLMRDEMHNLHTFYLKLNPWISARDVGHQSFLVGRRKNVRTLHNAPLLKSTPAPGKCTHKKGRQVKGRVEHHPGVIHEIHAVAALESLD